MNNQAAKSKSPQADDLTADLTEFMRRTENLVGTRTSFHAEFCMLSHRDAKLCYQSQADHALALMSNYLKGKVVSTALAVPTGEAMPVETDHGVGPGRRSDLAILPSPLDDASYGDEDNFEVVTHFYGVAARPLPFESFSRCFLQVTDRLEAAPFRTNDYTGLTARVLLEDHLAPADALAFALHCDEMSWMERGGRRNGRINNAQSYWSLRTFRDMIIWQFVERDLNFDLSTPAETWVEHLSDVAQMLVEDGLEAPACLDPSGRYADFSHIGGQSYTKDFVTNLEVLQEMAGAIKAASCSDVDAYWAEPANAALLRDLIEEILDVQRISDGVVFEPIEATFYATFKVVFEGKAWGKVTDWDHAPGTISTPLEGSLVVVGDFSDSATTANALPYMAASMIRRSLAG